MGRLLKGHCLRDGIDQPIRLIENHYCGKATNALVAALKDLHTHYEQIHFKTKAKL